MPARFSQYLPDPDPAETAEWLESFQAVVERSGKDRAQYLLGQLLKQSVAGGMTTPTLLQTPYVNTIPAHAEPPFPGDETMEKRIRRLVRWNAAVMVIRANRKAPGIGGHLSTYASAATLIEVGFNHFFRGRDSAGGGDQIYFPGHAAPGIYARAFLEGRLTQTHLEHFRRELQAHPGLSSYPHPWLMPDFWEFPTVSMGLGPLCAIYQARFNRYLAARGIKDTSKSRVWAFLGDGECDEPEALGALSVAGREGLDNLIFVVNCNLQRLDGPVRGNGKIIQELETNFHGAGWNVIKVIWGEQWDPLLAQDRDGILLRRMEEAVDGDYQRYAALGGAYVRKHFFGVDPRLESMVRHLSDRDLQGLRRGGHSVRKVYAAYRAAVESSNGKPTAILAKTVKGWTLGEGAQARNVAHQQKTLSETDLKAFRDLLHLPISDDELADPPFYHPGPKSPEVEYLRERRAALGGAVPRRLHRVGPVPPPARGLFEEFHRGSGDVEASTTMVFVRLLANLIRKWEWGKHIVPIIPDEARTFGMEALFRQVGIYSAAGQRYEPVDSDKLLFYRETKDGQVLEEGICEAGAGASFVAAGTAATTHGTPMLPFYIFYSMFGFQRIGDLLWAAADQRTRGFLLGATAGRTTLHGEGLQHQDGHHLLLMSVIPTCRIYEPAFAYELAVIIEDGIRRMLHEDEETFYYIALQNEPYRQPAMPAGCREGILNGLYRFSEGPDLGPEAPRVRLLGSGSILLEAIRAQHILAEQFGVRAEVWSATSYTQLRREALAVERWNRLHPLSPARTPLVTRLLSPAGIPNVAASDYMKAVPDQIQRWVPDGLVSLGTDGFGRSDTRSALRRHFEVDAESIAVAALDALRARGSVSPETVQEAITRLGIDAEKEDPLLA